jgi:hypothetical protein
MIEIDSLIAELTGDDLDAENIDWQKNNPLGPELEAELENLRGAGRVRLKDVKDSRINDIIFKHTGIKSVTVGMPDDYNAYAMWPSLTSDHPFLEDQGTKGLHRQHVSGGKPKAPFVGGVNTKMGRLTGDFSKIHHEMGIGMPFLNDKRFDVKEIVAIMLHEIGHLFTYYSHLLQILTTNYHMKETVERAFEIKDEEQRIAFCTKAQLKRGELSSMDEIGKAKSKEQLQVIFFNDILKDSNSELGSDLYSHRGWEYLADRFATRHGYGDQIVSGLARMYDIYGVVNPADTWGYRIVQFVFFAFLTMAYGLSLLILALTDQQQKVYDDPKKRFQVVRKGVIENMKATNASKEDIREMLRQINRIDEIVNKMEDDLPSSFEWLQRTFGFIRGREQYRNITTQQLLEHFANSEFRVQAERFNQL